MRLEKWALIVEIIGSAAVVGTLILVLLEIRANTAAVQTQSYQDAVRLLLDNHASVYTNTEAAEVLYRGLVQRDASSLSPVEQFQLSFMSEDIFLIFETAFLSHDYEVMNDREWARWPPIICNAYTGFLEAGLWANIRGRFTPAFQEQNRNLGKE